MAHLGIRELTRLECLALLRDANSGQLALTRCALPRVVPARFVLRDDTVIVHISTGLDPVPWRDGEVVALHVSHFDADERGGWSVSVTGAAHGTPDLARHYDAPHAPWIPEGGGDLITLPTDIIWGERLTPADDTTNVEAVRSDA